MNKIFKKKKLIRINKLKSNKQNKKQNKKQIKNFNKKYTDHQ